MSYHPRSTSLLPWILAVGCGGAVFAACGGGNGDSSATSQSSHSTGSMGTGGDLGLGGSTNGNNLTIMPLTATITITDKNTPVMQAFTATLNGNPISDKVAWTLNNYNEGDITKVGVFTTTGIVGGKVIVTASVG